MWSAKALSFSGLGNLECDVIGQQMQPRKDAAPELGHGTSFTLFNVVQKREVTPQIVPRAFKIVPPLSKGPVSPSHLLALRSPEVLQGVPVSARLKTSGFLSVVCRWRRVKTSGPSPTASPSTLLRGPSSWLPGEEEQ